MFNAKIGRLSRVLAVALPALLAAIPSFRTHAEVQLPAAGEWVHFTEESGLPANHVDRVIETPAGSIWAVTSGGLAWYDGFRWNAAPPEVGCGSGWMGLVAEPFGRDQLLVVREGHFFIGDRSGFKEIVLPHLGAAADQLVHAIEGPDGRLLFECGLPKFPYSVRIFVREGERLTELETPNKPARPVGLPSLTRTASGQVFMRTERGLYRLTSKGYKAVNTEGPWEGAWGVAEGASGHGFVFVYAQGETGGLWEWSPGGPARKSEDWTENIVTAMAVASNGDAVIVYDDGAVRWRRDGAWVSPVDFPPGRCNILSVLFRTNGDLWATTEEGLFLRRAAPSVWTSWRHGATALDNRVQDIAQAQDGSIWIATASGVEVRKPDGSVEKIRSVLGQDLRLITAVAQDNEGVIWLASGSLIGPKGVFAWDGRDWRHPGAESLLGSAHVHRIQKDRHGRLWFLVLDGAPTDGGAGLVVLDGGRFVDWGREHGYPNVRPYAVSEGPDGALWFGTMDGILRWKDGVWLSLKPGDGLRDARVFTLTVDEQGRVWFGHQRKGLGVLENGKVRYLTRADGLPSEDVWELRLDSRSWLWVATRLGICVERDGRLVAVPDPEALWYRGFWPILPTEKRVYAGTRGVGTAVMDLGAIDRTLPKIAFLGPITDMNATVLRWIVRPYWGTANSREIHTRYRVDSGEWSRWNDTREVELRGLGGGRHRLEVDAMGPLADVAPEPARLDFEVPRSLLKRPAFILPMVASVATILVLLLVLRNRRRRHATELAASTRQYSELLENAYDLILSLDIAGRLMRLNRASEIALGRQAADAVGMDLAEIAAPEDQATVREIVRRAANGAHEPLREVEFRRADGEPVILEMTFRLVRGAGDKAPGIQVIARDVTQRRAMAKRLRDAEKMEAVGRLAGGVAHDFNNLLMVVLGYADIIETSLPQGHPGLDRVGQIRRASERGISLARQLLAFTRRRNLEPRSVDICRLLQDMEELLRRLLGEDVELTLACEPDVGRVRVDPGEMQQIILNLAANARDAMPTGGRLTIGASRETVGVPREGVTGEIKAGSYIRVNVSDTGMGMSEQARAHIFEPFFTTKDVGSGTGLGLFIVYGIVKQSGGDIEIESAPGKGASISLLLPESPAKTEEAGEGDGRTVTREPGAATILLVEDEPEVRAVLREALVGSGYRVFEAADGIEALEVWEQRPRPVDLLLTDVVMPRLNGFELASRLRLREPRLRVLFMSGYSPEIPSPPPGEHGVFDSLEKPFTRATLLAKIESMMRI